MGWIILKALFKLIPLSLGGGLDSMRVDVGQKIKKRQQAHKSETRQRICLLSLLIRVSIPNMLIVSAQGRQEIISLGLKLDCTLRALILNMQNRGKKRSMRKTHGNTVRT